MTALADGLDSETVKVMVPAASLTATSSMVMDGVPSSSVMVAVPVSAALSVVPAVTVAVRSKVSAASSMASSVIGVRTRTDVAPGANVADVAAVQVVPPSVETSRPGP